MNNLQQIIKIFQRLRTRYQLVLVLFLLVTFTLLSWCIARSQNKIKSQLRDKQLFVQQQQIWVAKRSKIKNEFEEIISKIKSRNQNQNLSLLSDIEEVVSHLGCKYELSDEIRSTVDDIVLSGVWLKIFGINIFTFVQLCDAIEEKKLNLSEVHIRVLKDDTLSVKCLIEPINLVQR